MKPVRDFLEDLKNGRVKDHLFRDFKIYYLSDYLYQADFSDIGKPYILSQLRYNIL
jgi:hypothetical protein